MGLTLVDKNTPHQQGIISNQDPIGLSNRLSLK